MINVNGHVLGINTSGLARGTALTIIADLAWQVAAALSQHGRVRRGYLGIRSQPVMLSPVQRQALGRKQRSGLLIISFEEDSPAEAAGLLVGDILVGLENQPLEEADHLLAMLGRTSVGQALTVEILRYGKRQLLVVTIGERRK